MPDPASVYQPTPQAKSKGGTRRVFGILLILFGIIPLLGTALTVYKTIQSSRERNSNDAFIPKAWHNLQSDEIFPARLTSETVGNDASVWARQGISKNTSCGAAFTADLARDMTANGCKVVLRATYTDLSGEMAATIGLVVADSPAAANAVDSKIERIQSDAVGSGRAPTVRPFTVPGTQAADWSEKMGIGGASTQVFMPDSPYAVTITTGPTDPARPVGQLPEPWTFIGWEERQPYRKTAQALATIYAEDLRRTVLGK
ncbi:hypothetical protein [Streptomyces pseudovenezuelae]|uniref:hypothetical protein n=1 Tax=Streptomyces pseudovenezuelae TaxID=67350 RepID=UPI002E812A22|nr:hypothetical protein [Streptomyces pseudovenezuelae]WUA88143.1 hypothetical protein OHO81_12920 [Streptomyces pseudovenezuelae]